MKSASSPSAKPRSMKPTSTSSKSKTDWERLLKPSSKGEPTREHPEADVKHIVRGIVRKGLKPAPSKALVFLRVDQDVLEWFKAERDDSAVLQRKHKTWPALKKRCRRATADRLHRRVGPVDDLTRRWGMSARCSSRGHGLPPSKGKSRDGLGYGIRETRARSIAASNN